MKSRRQFVKQGAFAAAALMVARPFQSLASANTVFGDGTEGKNFILLHYAHETLKSSYSDDIRSFKSKMPHAIIMNTGMAIPALAGFDVQAANSYDNEYSILYRGGIKTGFIHATPGLNVISRMNTLATYLKKQKNCSVVVCMSGLGYANHLLADDENLATESTNIDVIICSHKSNFPKRPVIAKNRNRAEVIIHSANATASGMGLITISFDANGKKNHVSVAGKLPGSSS